MGLRAKSGAIDQNPEDYDGDETIGGEYEPLGEYTGTTDRVTDVSIKDLNEDMPFDLETLDKLESMEDLVRLVMDTGKEVVDSRRIFAGGFVPCDKASLVNVPMMIIHWEFFYSKRFGCNGVAVHAMTERPIDVPGGKSKKVVFTDTSSGVFSQLHTRSQSVGHMDFIMCPTGLDANTYMTTDSNGDEIESTTYRIPV